MGQLAGLSGRVLGIEELAPGGEKNLPKVDKSGGLGRLGSMRSTAGGLEGSEARDYLSYHLKEGNLKFNVGADYSDFGMTPEDFFSEAFSRTKSRGTSEDWLKETYRQIGLEKSIII